VPSEDGEQRNSRPWRLGTDQGDRLRYPKPLKAQWHPDVVVTGLNDDKRGREPTKVYLRDLVGDRPAPARAGPHVAGASDPVDHGVPVQQAGQQDGP